MHLTEAPDYADYNFEKREFSTSQGYADSKLVRLSLLRATALTLPAQANIHFSQGLAKRGIVSLAIHPGAIWNTNAAQDLTTEWLDNLKGRIDGMGVQWKTPEQGAATNVFAALNPELKARSGSYLSDCAVEETIANARKEGAVEELWELSEKLVGEKFSS